MDFLYIILAIGTLFFANNDFMFFIVPFALLFFLRWIFSWPVSMGWPYFFFIFLSPFSCSSFLAFFAWDNNTIRVSFPYVKFTYGFFYFTSWTLSHTIDISHWGQFVKQITCFVHPARDVQEMKILIPIVVFCVVLLAVIGFFIWLAGKFPKWPG